MFPMFPRKISREAWQGIMLVRMQAANAGKDFRAYGLMISVLRVTGHHRCAYGLWIDRCGS